MGVVALSRGKKVVFNKNGRWGGGWGEERLHKNGGVIDFYHAFFECFEVIFYKLSCVIDN